MSDKNYIYAVARIRAHELGLLSGAFLDQLLASPDEETAVKLLQEKGWGAAEGAGAEGTDTDAMLTAETEKTWQLIKELVDDESVFNVFLYEKDFHNLKAAIKESCRAGSHPGIYREGGTVDVQVIRQAIEAREFDRLPGNMAAVAKEATDTLLKTRDGQLCDVIVDKAALSAIYQASKESGSELLALYGELTVATADIKIAVRGQKTGKTREFLNEALAPCESLSIDRLAEAAAGSAEAIYAYLESTAYAEAVGELKTSPAAFERWCDNRMIRAIKPQLYQSFGIGPLAAYILARDNEIKTVRIILSGKRNGFPDEFSRGRVREMYV